MSKLLDRAKNLKNTADKILSDSKITSILSEYGEIVFTGSYPLELMYRPDIDFFVLTKEHNFDLYLKLLKKIIETKYFKVVCTDNQIELYKGSGLKGYYIQPNIKINDENWKMDIWLTTHDQYKPHTEKYKKLLENTDTSKKELILEIKATLKKGKKYKEGIDGKIIYEAVLIEGIKNLDDFLEYVKS